MQLAFKIRHLEALRERGARYFALLKEQVPARIGDPDRTFLALAAYNAGQANVDEWEAAGGEIAFHTAEEIGRRAGFPMLPQLTPPRSIATEGQSVERQAPKLLDAYVE